MSIYPGLTLYEHTHIRLKLLASYHKKAMREIIERLVNEEINKYPDLAKVANTQIDVISSNPLRPERRTDQQNEG